MARLRAAQDHAARDAARQEARLHRAVLCTTSSTSSSPRWATRIRSSSPARDAIVKTVRAEEDRFDAVLTVGPAEARGAARPHRWRRAATVVPGDEVFRLYDSLGVPLDFAEDLAEPARPDDRSRRATTRRWRRQRERARAAARSTKKAPASSTTAMPSDVASRRWPIGSTATPTTVVERDRRQACSTTSAAQVEALPAGADGLRRARPHAVLRRVRRAGVGHGPSCSNGRRPRRRS